MDNFINEFFGGIFNENTPAKLEERLNYLIKNDFLEYCKFVNEVKSKGYKVLRNSDNKHKVRINL